MMREKECTDIWRRYQAGKDHHNRTNMYTRTEKCHRFYEGDQWHGLQSGDEELPVLNFIKPICRYKIVMVAMNDTAILFSPMDNDPKKAELCEALTAFAAAQWEKGKLDSKKWAVVKNACITGDHYLYCFDERTPSESVVTDMTPRLKMRLIDKTALYLADEQEPNLEEQEWIIIAERVPVENVRRQAKDNGLPEAEIRRIVSDEADETQLGVTGADEVQTDSGKCTSLLFMHKAAHRVRVQVFHADARPHDAQLLRRQQLVLVVHHRGKAVPLHADGPPRQRAVHLDLVRNQPLHNAHAPGAAHFFFPAHAAHRVNVQTVDFLHGPVNNGLR